MQDTRRGNENVLEALLDHGTRFHFWLVVGDLSYADGRGVCEPICHLLDLHPIPSIFLAPSTHPGTDASSPPVPPLLLCPC